MQPHEHSQQHGRTDVLHVLHRLVNTTLGSLGLHGGLEVQATLAAAALRIGQLGLRALALHQCPGIQQHFSSHVPQLTCFDVTASQDLLQLTCRSAQYEDSVVVQQLLYGLLRVPQVALGECSITGTIAGPEGL